jgi:hypothetical protein
MLKDAGAYPLVLTPCTRFLDSSAATPLNGKSRNKDEQAGQNFNPAFSAGDKGKQFACFLTALPKVFVVPVFNCSQLAYQYLDLIPFVAVD